MSQFDADLLGHGRPTGFGRIFPPDPAWLATQPPEEVLLPALRIIDAHHHLMDQPGLSYGLADYARDAASGHDVVASVYVECLSGYRQDGPEALRPVGETEFARRAYEASQDARNGTAVAAGIVGFVDLRLGDAVQDVLDAHIQAGGGLFKGVRFVTSWDPSPAISNNHQPGARPHLLGDAAVRAGLMRVAASGLGFDAWAFFTQLDEVAAMAASAPDLLIVLDHCGGPLGYGPYAGRPDTFATWEAGLREVARRPNTFCKLGGVLHRGAAYDYVDAPVPAGSAELARLWRPWIETCIEIFGPGRCMFESNFPVDKMGTGMATLWNAYKRIAAGCSEDEREQLFTGTARRFYRLDA